MQDYITIYLIRHARQNSSLCNVNVPLAQEGILQSRLLAERLREYGIEQVYSSHLIRAVMTADILREMWKLALDAETRKTHTLEALCETDFGELTGLSDKELREKYAGFYAARDQKTKDLRIPGGENGQEVYERMSHAMTQIAFKAGEAGHTRIAVVSHGGAIRCYLAGVLAMPQSHRYMIAKNMENTAITELRIRRDGQVLSVERINDYAHLTGHEELLRRNFKETSVP